ncbi:MAG: hypothetical protein K2L70_00770 [Clostridia bacterium]|nr:hypothetical protein [Clostridia bacterium]
MDYVWELIQPYVMAVLATLCSSGVVTLIVRAVVNKILNKNSAMLDKTYNIEKISKLVADKLAGKTMNIDVTAVTEKSLKKTTKQLDERIEKVESIGNSHTAILIAMAKGIIKLKALSEDEKEEIASAVQLLEKGYKPPEIEEIMTVKLAPIELGQDEFEITEAGGEESDSESGGVNFGGLDE